MNKIFFIIAFILNFISIALAAAPLSLNKNGTSIFISQKDGWRLEKDLFGIPFIYFSPIANGQRSNISFTDTGADLELDIKILGSTQSEFQKIKRNWAKQIAASPLNFIPYQVSINMHGHKVHQIGFVYEHKGKRYQEKSFYIECRNKLIYSKSLRLVKNKAHEKIFSEILNDLDCGGI